MSEALKTRIRAAKALAALIPGYLFNSEDDLNEAAADRIATLEREMAVLRAGLEAWEQYSERWERMEQDEVDHWESLVARHYKAALPYKIFPAPAPTRQRADRIALEDIAADDGITYELSGEAAADREQEYENRQRGRGWVTA